MATFIVTLLMKKFTSIVMDDRILDEFHATYRNKVWYILHPHNSMLKMLPWMSETWMETHLVSDGTCNTI
jgi:hypothetical protein